MAKKIFYISGRVIDHKSGNGIEGLKVEAWDKDLLFDDLIGSAETQANGLFEFKFDASYFKELFLDRSPDLFFKVFLNGILIKSTEDSVLWNTDSGKTSLVIEVDVPVESKKISVRGRVLQADGSAVEAITVKAFDKDLRQEALLGEAKTDTNGQYAITYTSEQLSQADKTNADLIVRAYDDSGEEVAVSGLILSAAQVEVVELIVGNETYRGPAEYARVSQLLMPFLREINSADLTSDEITYLASKTDIDPVHIAYFVKGARLEQKTEIDAENLYGLFRQDLPTSLTALIAQDPAVQKRALLSAVHDNIIGKDREQEIEQVLVKLQSQIVDHAFEQPEIPDRYSLSELLDSGDFSHELQRSFMQTYVAHQGTIEEFWQGLREDAAFGDTTVENIQFTIRLGALTLNHVPLVNLLQQQRQSGEVSSLRDLARLTQQDWIELINQQVDDKPVGFPPMVPGETDEEKISSYALTMTHIMEDAFPTAVISYRIKPDDFEHAQTVADFLQVNPEFDFRQQRIDCYLAENEDALAGNDNKEALVSKLKSIQRLFNISTRYDKCRSIQTLLADGVDSAYAICRMGKAEFKRKYSGSFNEEEFELIYAQADQSTATSQNIYARYGAEFYIPTGVTPEQSEFVDGIPEWRSLFGSLSLCNCEHCRSVYSPAAYLVDILHFLSHRVTENLSALDVLFERRGDIGEIDLNCKNTNTVLPYVDLVNEALENAVVPDGAVYQTSGRAEELRVEPEHVNNAAYAMLASAVYPWSLPFSLPAEEARLYLNHLGVPRHELMAIMSNQQSAITEFDIAIEHLCITPLQRDIITGNTSEAPHTFWGMNQAEWNAWLVDPKVSVLLKQSRLEYETLTELLAVEFINPDNEMQVEFPGAGCNLQEAVIVNISEEALERDRLHRFIRLQAKVDITIRELAAALQALPDQELTNTFLLNLSNVLRLKEKLNTSIIPMLSWWSDIDIISHDNQTSLYESLFLNKAVTNPVNEAFQLEAMGTNPFDINVHVATVLAGLEISDEELALLLEYKAPAHAFNLLLDNSLSLVHLSRLFAAVSFADALKCSISDLLTLMDLSGINPFENTQATLEFVELNERVNASEFTISELNFLLRNQGAANVDITPSEEQTGLLLSELRDGLKKIPEENQSATDPAGEQATQALGNLLSETELELAIAIIGGTSTESDTQQNNFIDNHFAVFLDVEEAKEKLVATGPNSISVDAKEQRFNYVLQPLLTYLGQRNLVKQKLADAIELDMASCDQLLTSLVPAKSDTTQTAMADFLSLSFINSEVEPLSEIDFPDQFRQFVLLGKIAIFITRFKIPSEELAWVFEHGNGFGWLEFNTLDSAQIEDLFSAWLRMAHLSQLASELNASEADLYTLFHSLQDGTINSNSQFATELGAMSGCAETDVGYLIGAQGIDLTNPTDFLDENAVARLTKLVDAFDVIKRLGVSAEQAWNWNTISVIDDQALNIKRAVKAKYEEEHWLNVAQPLRDNLRETQRSALIDYLVHSMRGQGVDDASDLFGYFLLDVEMNACMMTSRIKQANSSVQLFVQRCLMNLEPEVQLQPSDAKEWAWMKNYRVWEANRKIFLYPENWIEPELREDKSPFFKDLENELLQNDVTLDTVESAYLNYLEKLDEVAQLEVSGMYEDTDAGELHVFARTQNIPHVYYYRRWINKAYWTPWERVDVDVQGDHLIPVVYNHRLYLFWSEFIDKAVENIPDVGDSSVEKKPIKYFEVKMAWSVYKNNTWSAKKVSSEFIKFSPSPDKLRLRFRGNVDQDNNINISIDEYNRKGTSLLLDYNEDFIFTSKGNVEKDWADRWIYTPNPAADSHAVAMKFIEKKNNNNFEIIIDGDMLGYSLYKIKTATVLQETPGCFSIILPHQYWPFLSQSPFYYEDNRRTFFVIPRDPLTLLTLEAEMYSVDSVRPESIDSVTDTYGIKKEKNLFGNIVDKNYRSGSQASSVSSNINVSTRTDSQANIGTISDTSMMQSQAILERVESIIAGTEVQQVVPKKQLDKYFRFDSFYHPYSSTLIKQLNLHGIDRLLNPCDHIDEYGLCRQLIKNDFFEDEYVPTDSVDESYPLDEIDFNYNGAYSSYNWELFFHAPFLIANRLSDNQRFAEAQKWYHYIFNPTDVSQDEEVPARFWKIKEFYEASGGSHIQELMQLLAGYSSDPKIQKLQRNLRDQINAWRQDPFKPHVIARLRIIAYQKTIVMKYLDNLIAWGDNLFRRDTIESINEATQLYVLAAQILGKRPTDVITDEATVKTIDGEEVSSFNDLADHLDEFSNALIELETILPAAEIDNEIIGETQATLAVGPSLFFCIPRNNKLLEYWDTVSDRLFKLRHCMNIEGVMRQLPLFEPPIPPGLLVKAAAAGVDISSALSDLYAPMALYRYQIMLQKAVEFCADVKNLGALLLSAHEKRDAEGIALLRSNQELNLLDAVAEVKQKLVNETEKSLEGLFKTKEVIKIRETYYASRKWPSAWEAAHLTLLGTAGVTRGIGQLLTLGAGQVNMLPDISIGAAGAMCSPVTITYPPGPDKISKAMSKTSTALMGTATILETLGQMSSIMGSFDRRRDEWRFQANVASAELEQIEKQIAAAEVRLAITKKELNNHELQTENSKEVDIYMREKFTNQQLYSWMVSQISTMYFQSYQMAYDLAKRAEKAFRHEIGDNEATFIEFGYWDSLKKGLLAGDRLHYDLRRMDAAYLDQNKREFELTKHVSLAMLDPLALITLKQTGDCFIELPEALFDFDYSSHYLRRIKSVSLTIPCVTGPYTGVNCTLTLLDNRVRMSTGTNTGYGYVDCDDERFLHNIHTVNSIATSAAQNDSGVFELNFRDERYLPFEGAGAISSWRIEMPRDCNHFDFDTITDVIMHVKYTARDGGAAFKEAVLQYRDDAIEGLFNNGLVFVQMFSAKHAFSADWQRFLHPDEGESPTLKMPLDDER